MAHITKNKWNNKSVMGDLRTKEISDRENI